MGKLATFTMRKALREIWRIMVNGAVYSRWTEFRKLLPLLGTSLRVGGCSLSPSSHKLPRPFEHVCNFEEPRRERMKTMLGSDRKHEWLSFSRISEQCSWTRVQLRSRRVLSFDVPRRISQLCSVLHLLSFESFYDAEVA